MASWLWTTTRLQNQTEENIEETDQQHRKYEPWERERERVRENFDELQVFRFAFAFFNNEGAWHRKAPSFIGPIADLMTVRLNPQPNGTAPRVKIDSFPWQARQGSRIFLWEDRKVRWRAAPVHIGILANHGKDTARHITLCFTSTNSGIPPI